MKFKDLKVGDFFEWNGSYYQKVEFFGEEGIYYASCLESSGEDKKGKVYFVPELIKVTRIVFTGVHAMEDR